MEYFKKISVKTVPQTIIDSPIRIQEVAILQNSVDMDILGRVKFVNQSSNNVIAVFVDLEAKDISGETIPLENPLFIFQDMVVSPGELYGNEIAINLPDAVRILSVEINRVVFEDGSVWKASDAKTCNPLPLEQMELPKKNADRIRSELTEIILNVEYINYYYQENDTAWLCSCGRVNSTDEEICPFCDCIRSSQEQILTKDKFKSFCNTIDDIVRKEKEEEAKKEAEERQRKKEEENRKREEDWQRLKESRRQREEAERKSKARQRRILGIVIPVLVLVAAIVCDQIYESRMAERTSYASAEEMKTDLQGRYSNSDDGHRTITIDGDTVTQGKFETGSRYECNVQEWNYEKGTFTTDDNAKFIALADGNIKNSTGELFKRYIDEDALDDTTDSAEKGNTASQTEPAVTSITIEGTITEYDTDTGDGEAIVLKADDGKEYTIFTDEAELDLDSSGIEKGLYVAVTLKDTTAVDGSFTATKIEELDDPSIGTSTSDSSSKSSSNSSSNSYSKSSSSKSSSSSSSTTHTCQASGCSKEGTHSIMGLNGTLEYYCSEHYSQLNGMMDMILGD